MRRKNNLKKWRHATDPISRANREKIVNSVLDLVSTLLTDSNTPSPVDNSYSAMITDYRNYNGGLLTQSVPNLLGSCSVYNFGLICYHVTVNSILIPTRESVVVQTTNDEIPKRIFTDIIQFEGCVSCCSASKLTPCLSSTLFLKPAVYLSVHPVLIVICDHHYVTGDIIVKQNKRMYRYNTWVNATD